jgi:hypothetical protein
MGNLQGLEKMDDTCGKTGHRGRVDRGFTVFGFIVFIYFKQKPYYLCNVWRVGYASYMNLLVA